MRCVQFWCMQKSENFPHWTNEQLRWTNVKISHHYCLLFFFFFVEYTLNWFSCIVWCIFTTTLNDMLACCGVPNTSWFGPLWSIILEVVHHVEFWNLNDKYTDSLKLKYILRPETFDFWMKVPRNSRTCLLTVE